MGLVTHHERFQKSVGLKLWVAWVLLDGAIAAFGIDAGIEVTDPDWVKNKPSSHLESPVIKSSSSSLETVNSSESISSLSLFSRVALNLHMPQRMRGIQKKKKRSSKRWTNWSDHLFFGGTSFIKKKVALSPKIIVRDTCISPPLRKSKKEPTGHKRLIGVVLFACILPLLFFQQHILGCSVMERTDWSPCLCSLS